MPPAINSMSIWAYQSAIDGWVAVHGDDGDPEDGGMSAEAQDDLWDGIIERM
jgi:hypothetical protein